MMLLCCIIILPNLGLGNGSRFVAMPLLEGLFNSSASVEPLKRSVNAGSPQPLLDTSQPGIHQRYIPEDYDITKHLMNNELQYQKVW